MSNWVKVHNTMPSSPKFVMAGDRAGWLFLCGLCYSNEHLTDGLISRAVLPIVAPGVQKPERLAEVLVSVGLWDAVEGGWQIHDYLDYQRSAAEVKEMRAKDAKRQALRRSESARKPSGVDSGVRADTQRDSTRNPLGVTAAREEERREEKRANALSSSDADAPDPASGSSDEREREKASDDDRRLCRLLAERIRARNPKAKIGSDVAWLRSMRLMRERDGHTVQEIEQVISWLFTDPGQDAAFWADTIQSASGLRDHFGQVWVKMSRQVSGNVVRAEFREPGKYDRAAGLA